MRTRPAILSGALLASLILFAALLHSRVCDRFAVEK